MWDFLKNFFPPKKEKIVDDSLYFHGFNLDEWNYLGYEELKYTYTEGGGSTAYVYMFEHQTLEKSEYKIVSNSTYSNFKNHPYVLTSIDLWRIYEKPSWRVISFPSDALEEQLKELGYEWDHNLNDGKGWWKKIPQYEKSEGTNVITLKK